MASIPHLTIPQTKKAQYISLSPRLVKKLRMGKTFYFGVKHEREFTRCQYHQHFTRGFFRTKVLCKDFCTYILGLNFFWCKNISTTAALEMLVKLTKGVSITNILRPAFFVRKFCTQLFSTYIVTITITLF